MDLKQLPIEKSVTVDFPFPSVSDRYFNHYYFVPKNPFKKTFLKPGEKVLETDGQKKDSQSLGFHTEGEDTCIMIHSNRICVVTLSPKHPIIQNKKTIVKVDFSVGGVDRLANKVSGKGKRGAQIVGLFSPICSLQCSDGEAYTVYAGIRGKLIEVNSRLIDNPNLICDSTYSDGYLAVVLPKLNSSDNYKEFLLSKEEYNSL